jgi:hypothetical protein
MASVGSTILASDYNAIRNKIIAVMGAGGTNPNTGSTDLSFGYSQTTNSLAVAATSTITKAQFDNLKNDILNAKLHQDGTSPTITTVAVGDVIKYSATNPVFQYETLADTAITNRFNIGVGYYSIASARTDLVGGTLAPRTFTSSWTSSLSCEVTVTWSSASAMRYFFNTGGRIRFASSFVPSLGTNQNTVWQNTLSGAGTQSFGAANSGNGSINFYNLTTSFQTWHTVNSSSSYAANNWRLQARAASGTCSTSSVTATALVFRLEWNDPYTDPGPPAPGDLVQGTLTLSTDEQYAGSPSGIPLLPTVTPPAIQPVWAVTRPLYTATSITGS